jgi:dTMP kinase
LKRPRIIVFTGIDGSGKTTHAKLLTKYLNERGVTSRYVHLLEPNFKIAEWMSERIGRKVLSKENELFSKKGSGVRQKFTRRLMKALGLLFLLRGMYQSWMKLIRNRDFSVMVFDRYAYDDFIRTLWKYGDSFEGLALSLMIFIPRPDLVFNLTLPPEEAWRREKESNTNLEQHKQKKNYHDYFVNKIRQKTKVIEIDTNTESIEKAQEEIRSIALKELLVKNL